ncbi:MAG: hypothetical protein P8X57_07180, partial [Cyclobacteriaceae bacterium]
DRIADATVNKAEEEENIRQEDQGESSTDDKAPKETLTTTGEDETVNQDKLTDQTITDQAEIQANIQKAEIPDDVSMPETEIQPVAVAALEKTNAGQTLTFSIEEFENAEESVASNSQTQQESEEGLKKVWSFLKQVKEPEAGLGELRELKNNILAFGTDKDKKERN